VGFDLGAGVRVLPSRSIPDGGAPRLDLGCIEVRRAWSNSWSHRIAPDRLDLQVDWMHRAMTRLGSRSVRLPLTAYATWVRPAPHLWDLALSTGVYTELGRDSVVIDDQLRTHPAGTVAWAGRLGLEHPRFFWKKSATMSTWLKLSVGVSVSSEPALPVFSRHVRLGLERSWVWGVGPGRAR